jgi:hypothetical protein
MSNTIRLSIPMSRGAMLAAPRHIWLATLGAAAVTRDWADKEAGTVFRTLVKEGSVVESRAIRLVGSRIETSMKRANALARDARSGIKSSVESLASAASSFVRTKLPTVRARIDVESASPNRKPAAKTAKGAQGAVRTRATSTRRTAKSRAKK